MHLEKNKGDVENEDDIQFCKKVEMSTIKSKYNFVKKSKYHEKSGNVKNKVEMLRIKSKYNDVKKSECRQYSQNTIM